MGLFDSIAGQVLGSLSAKAGGNAGLLEAIGGLLNNPQTGGLPGLVSAFEQKGLGGLIASWISTGQNQPVSADQLTSVLGNDQVRAIAERLGFSPDQAADQLSQLLPQVVDRLTPDGNLPEQGALGDLLGGLLGRMKG